MADDALAPSARVAALPFLKWAGGKRSLVETIVKYLPADMSERVYLEPFLGGGALFFWLQHNRPPKQAILTDANSKLTSCYLVVRDLCSELRENIRALELDRERQGPEAHYYAVRERFNDGSLNRIARAAHLIYLNRTGFNGLYRSSKKGAFNVPWGRHETPPEVDDIRIKLASRALKDAAIFDADFGLALRDVKPGDVVYLDPPYVPASKSANFTGYSSEFGLAEHQRLSDAFRDISKRGCWAVMSNSDTPLVRELYQGFRIVELDARRSIAAAGESRKPAKEVLILSDCCDAR